MHVIILQSHPNVNVYVFIHVFSQDIIIVLTVFEYTSSSSTIMYITNMTTLHVNIDCSCIDLSNLHDIMINTVGQHTTCPLDESIRFKVKPDKCAIELRKLIKQFCNSVSLCIANNVLCDVIPLLFTEAKLTKFS